MNIAFYLLTYNRPKILSQCLNTLIGNTKIRPNEMWIIDDGSQPEVKNGLLDLSFNNYGFPINLLIHGKNYGIGYSFERVYNLIRQNDDLDIACIIESDYIWRKDWMEDVISVFEADENIVAIAGVDHPDMYDKFKTLKTFPEIMIDQFGKDLDSRNHLYNPFDLKTNRGNIRIQGVSNSCGCQILHWKRFRNIISELENNKIISFNDYWKRMDRAFNKGITHDTRKNASDGHMSSTISMYGEMYLKLKNIDLTKNFPFVSICDYSISQHICGQGANGMIVREGETFIHSPTWSNEYLNNSPRIISN